MSYALLIVWGRAAYFLFHLDTDITTPNGAGVMTDEGGYMPVSQGGQSGINSFGGNEDPSKLKVKGAIWVRESLENGGNFYLFESFQSSAHALSKCEGLGAFEIEGSF